VRPNDEREVSDRTHLILASKLTDRKDFVRGRSPTIGRESECVSSPNSCWPFHLLGTARPVLGLSASLVSSEYRGDLWSILLQLLSA